jgi:hypothetical protein
MWERLSLVLFFSCEILLVHPAGAVVVSSECAFCGVWYQTQGASDGRTSFTQVDVGRENRQAYELKNYAKLHTSFSNNPPQGKWPYPVLCKPRPQTVRAANSVSTSKLSWSCFCHSAMENSNRNMARGTFSKLGRHGSRKSIPVFWPEKMKERRVSCTIREITISR